MNLKNLKKFTSSIKYKINRIFHEKILFKMVSKEKIFASIWRNNYWGSIESLSGPGSTLDYTLEIRKKMPIMFEKLNIKSVFDAPCGDLHWMQHVLKEANFTYLGGDIVGDIIMANKSKFSNSRVNFIKFDMTADRFPDADVWLSRAVFYHLSNRDIYLALEQFAASNIKYILTTSHITGNDHINEDIKTGDWRLLNLTMPPFIFPHKPIWEVNDYIDPHPAATLTLWSKEQILSILPALRKVYQR